MLLSAGGFTCVPRPQRTFGIKNGRLDYQIQPFPLSTSTLLPAWVDTDGALHGRILYGAGLSGMDIYQAIFTGHISGDTLEATVTDWRCESLLVARRSPP
jgi:hypothetical protein